MTIHLRDILLEQNKNCISLSVIIFLVVLVQWYYFSDIIISTLWGKVIRNGMDVIENQDLHYGRKKIEM